MSRKDALQELRREMSMRETVYPSRVSSGKMPKATAERQISRLRASIQVLDLMTDKEFSDILARTGEVHPGPVQTTLFG